MSTRRVSIVPHTHWDREWYSPFQTFRLRLVDLLDSFLDHLDGDPTYRHFLLDGQMAVIDDYLEVRPEAEPRLQALAESGRLAVGPWYILMDEFLVSAETIWRNLQMGLQRAEDFGGAMNIGYLPDMFGHVAQMPQILRQAGFEHAVVWRGVPAAIGRTAFWWESPDGSRVRAEYLPVGYGNGAAIPESSEAFVGRVTAHETEIAPLLGEGWPMLLMNGTDHQTPQPWLGRVVAEANAAQDHLRFEVTSLAQHLATAPKDGLRTWTGELRSGARANLLMGVTSNRTDVKQAAARAERALERMAEPLCALFLDRWPEELLDLAWREMVLNSAHDSICACSHDEVVDAVLHRFAEARQIADGLADRAVRALRATLAQPGTYAVNPSARPRSGLIEAVVEGDADVEGAQVLAERASLLSDIVTSPTDLPTYLGLIRSQQLDETTFVTSVEVDDGHEELLVTLYAEDRLRTNLLVDELKQRVLALAQSRPERPVHIRVVQAPARRLLVQVDDVPGFGWRRWTPGPVVDPVLASETGLSNARVRVEVDAVTGSFSVNGQEGFDRLVDQGDHGDTYNYSPPDHDTVVDRPTSVSINVDETGPLRGRLRVTRTFVWPAAIDDATRSRTGRVETEVTTTIELRACEGLVRVHTTFFNQCRDHRLRSHFPLPEAATTSRAECAFAVVERGLTAEGGPTERGLPTFPSRRFVRAGGLTVVHEGLLEYELVAGEDGLARELALTLLRCTGMLSRVEMTYRPMPAGPPNHLEGPQMVGPVEARYGICVDAEADPFRLVEDAFLPLVATRAPGGGPRAAFGSALTVEGGEVSAVYRKGDALEVRVFNPSAEDTTIVIDGAGRQVDLRGHDVGHFDGQISLTPWAIATLRIL